MKTRPALVLALFLSLLLVSGCSSTNPAPQSSPRRERGMVAIAGVELMLPSTWWREPRLVEPLQLSSDQFSRLDALEPKQEEVERLQRDVLVAGRELRDALDGATPTAAEIVASGEHFRELHQTLLERQIELLAAEREILKSEQWTQLQSQIAAATRPQQMNRPGNRGRSGFGGGRRPGRPW